MHNNTNLVIMRGTIEVARWIVEHKDQLEEKDVLSMLKEFGKNCVDIGIRIQRTTNSRVMGANERLKKKRKWENIQACEIALLSIVDDCMSACDSKCKVKTKVNLCLKGCAVMLPEKIENAIEIINAEPEELIMRKH